MSVRVFIVLLLGLCLIPEETEAQNDYGFRFVRIRYSDDSGMGRFGGNAWAHDYPTADYNFHEALTRASKIHVDGPPIVLSLDDPRIFEYPVLYLCEPGYWNMSEEDVENLREYLNRGGFILFDDFRSERELFVLTNQMKRLYPDREFTELPATHPIWNIYFDIDPVEAPSNVSSRWGGMGKYDDQYLALFDENGRMIALSCYNQDIGDGWEWPDRNIADASTISFQMGINFLMYALTH